MTRHICVTLLLLFAGILLSGCGNDDKRELRFYRVSVTLTPPLASDSAWLTTVDDDYQALRELGAVNGINGSFEFSGQTDCTQLAYLRLGTDSTRFVLPFALSPDTIRIHIKPHSWIITGGTENQRYQRFLNRYRQMGSQRAALWKSYQKLAADSTLTEQAERDLARRDSLVADSMRRYLTWRVRQPDLAARLIKLRLGNQLDTFPRTPRNP